MPPEKKDKQDDAGNGGQDTTGAEPRDNQQQPPATQTGQGDQPTNQTQVQPYAVFPTAEALSERLGRAQQQGVSQLLESLGIQDADALKTLVTAQRELEEATKSDVEKLQGKLDTALKSVQSLAAERDQLASQLKLEREDRLVERLAGDLGFADVTDATSLVERAGFEYSDAGQVTEASIEAALKALLEAKPHLRGQTPKPAPKIDAQAGKGKGPAEPQSAGDYNAHLPARLRPRQGVAPQQ